MSMIPEVKCRRCGATFSSMRSRCPNCGTRRVAQSGRAPSTTPGTVKGTASYERAETNTKWQMIFGLILVVAVILAVIVMVSTSLDGSDSSNKSTAMTPPVVTDYVPIIEAAPRLRRHRRRLSRASRSSSTPMRRRRTSPCTSATRST